MTLAIPFLAIVLAQAFCEGEDIDRLWIVVGVILAFGMSAVPTYSKNGENIDA